MDDDQVKYLFFRNGWKCLQRRILNHLGVNSVSTSTSAIKNLWWEIHSNTNTFYFNILYLQHKWKFHENDNKNYNTSDNKTNSCECKALKMYSIYSNLWWKLFSFSNLAWEIHSAHKSKMPSFHQPALAKLDAFSYLSLFTKSEMKGIQWQIACSN